MGWWNEFVVKGGFTRPKNLSLYALGVYGDSGRNGSALLVAIFCFTIIHLAWKKEVLQKQALGSILPRKVRAVWSLPARAVWIWNQAKAGVPQKFLVASVLSDPTSFFDWAGSRNINQVWIDVWPVLSDPTKLGDLKKFCHSAKESGVLVNFLALAAPGFAVKENHLAANQQLGQIYDLIDKIDADDRPVGIQADIEPHTLTSVKKYTDDSFAVGLLWPGKAPQILSEFLDLVTQLRETSVTRNATLGQYVNLCFAVPRFFLDAKATDTIADGSSQLVGNDILACGVDVAVMDYLPPGSNLAKISANNWANAAGEFGQLAWIGFESNPDDPPNNYAGQGAFLEKDIQAFSSSLQDAIGFATMAVDDANGYVEIMP